MKRSALLLTLILQVSGTSAYSAPKAEFYVAVDGSDANPGTVARPFATLSRARDGVREMKSKSHGLDNQITVLIRGGTYQIDKTVCFESEDSGTAERPILYAAYPGEKPVFSGGKRITGFKPGADGKWQAKTDIPNFRQLYVNGRRAVRARGGTQSKPSYYQYGDHVREKQVPGGSLANAALWGDTTRRHARCGYRTTDAGITKWRNQSDIELGYYSVWCQMIGNVDSIVADGEGGAIVRMRQPTFWLLVNKDGKKATTPDYIENALELLDEPGEWYLDRAGDTVYYLPRDGEDLENADVIAPVLQTLMLVRGSIHQPVHDIHFKGLTFAHGGWLRPGCLGHTDMQSNFVMDPRQEDLFERKTPSGEKIISNIHNQYVKSPAHVVVTAGKSIRFERCTFTKLGSAGLDIQRGSQDNTVRGCEFCDISGSGIQIGDVLEDDHHPKDKRLIVKNNKIVNNYVHDAGVEYEGSVGIFAGYTDGTLIAHNEVYNLPCMGISVGWGWGEEDPGGNPKWPQLFGYDEPTPAGNNILEYNHVHHVQLKRTEGGGIYVLGSQPGSLIRGNHVHDNKGLYGAISTDMGTAGFEFVDNLVYNVKSPSHTAYQNVKPGAPGFPQAVADRAGLEAAYRDLLSR